MFDEKEIAEFQDIKAPSGLRTRVLADCQRKRRPFYRYIQTVAACFAIVLAVGFVWTQATAPTIYVNGEEFRGESIRMSQSLNMAAQRNVHDGNEYLTVTAKRDTKLSLSKGEMLVYDVETGELLFSGREYSANGKVAIQVTLNEGENTILEISSFLSSREIQIECSK